MQFRAVLSVFVWSLIVLPACGSEWREEARKSAQPPKLTLESGEWATPEGTYRLVVTAEDRDGVAGVDARIRKNCRTDDSCAVGEGEIYDEIDLEPYKGRWAGELEFDGQSARVEWRSHDEKGNRSVWKEWSVERDDPDDDVHVILQPDDLSEDCKPDCGILTGNLVVVAVPGLQNFEDAPMLTDIAGELEIRNNAELESLDGLGSLRSAGKISIHGNTPLETLTGLSGLTSVGFFEVFGNPTLTTLGDIGLARTEGTIKLEKNRSLEDLSGLDDLQRVARLRIRKNETLDSLDGLESLDTVKEGLTLDKNPSLDVCEVKDFVDGLETKPDSYLLPDAARNCE